MKQEQCIAQAVGHDQPLRDDGGFVSLLLNRVSWDQLKSLNQRRHAAGRPTYKLSRSQLLVGLLFHYTVSWAGSLAEHMVLLGLTMAPSTLSQRRQALPFRVFEQLLELVLKPLEETHPQAPHYQGMRLVGLDGTSFSLANTQAIVEALPKPNNQHGAGPFAKLCCTALVELTTHNPLAARLGLKGESEWKLAQEVLAQLPPRCLLLADRLYGCGALIVQAMRVLAPQQGHLLVRIKKSLKVVEKLRRLSDGSRLVRIKALDPDNYHRTLQTMEVREIHASIQRPGHRVVSLRLWTSLLDDKRFPASQLVSLYTQRWEQELYFRELKRELRVNHLLHSQTVETAAQEVAAMIIGSALIAGERAKLKPGESLSHRISFIKTWETLEPLWMTLLLGADVLTKKQKAELADRFYRLASQRAMAKKRSRSCPRALRKSAKPWPKKTNQKSYEGPVEYKILKLA